jgi:hypothetical protein
MVVPAKAGTPLKFLNGTPAFAGATIARLS